MAAPDSEGITTASSSEFELRVLGGLQAGARAHLIADGRWITLGRDGDADIVLREAPFQQAAVRWFDGAWWWRLGQGPERVWPTGYGMRAASLTLAVGEIGSAWCSPDQLIEATELDHEVQGIQGEDGAAKAADSAASGGLPNSRPAQTSDPDLSVLQGPHAEVVRPASSGAGATKGGGRPIRRYGFWLSSWGLLLALGLWWWSAGGEDPVLTEPSGSGQGGAALQPDDPVGQLGRLLARHPLSDTLTLSPGPEGRVLIKGIVPDDETLEVMLRPVLGSGLKVSLQVLTMPEFEARVQALDSLLPADVSASATPLGRVLLRMEGEPDASPDEWVALARSEIPESLGVEVERKPARPSVGSPMSPKSKGDAPPGHHSAEFPQVMAVVGGASAHIVLRDGSRVLPGGRVNGLTLREVGAAELVFQDDDGLMRRMPR